MKRPRKDEIASVVKHLRSEAVQERNYAKGDLERMQASAYPESCAKSAKQHADKADRFEKVANWIMADADDIQKGSK